MPRRRTRTAATEVPRLSDEDIEYLTEDYEDFRAQEATAKKKADAIKDKILDEMKARGVKQIEWDGGRVTRVAAKKITISLDLLRENLPTRTFNKITTRTLDKSLLSAAIQQGIVDAGLIAEATTEGENAPYINVSHGTGD